MNLALASCWRCFIDL